MKKNNYLIALLSFSAQLFCMQPNIFKNIKEGEFLKLLIVQEFAFSCSGATKKALDTDTVLKNLALEKIFKELRQEEQLLTFLQAQPSVDLSNKNFWDQKKGKAIRAKACFYADAKTDAEIKDIVQELHVVARWGWKKYITYKLMHEVKERAAL